jgi:hypothetical protein
MMSARQTAMSRARLGRVCIVLLLAAGCAPVLHALLLGRSAPGPGESFLLPILLVAFLALTVVGTIPQAMLGIARERERRTLEPLLLVGGTLALRAVAPHPAGVDPAWMASLMALNPVVMLLDAIIPGAAFRWASGSFRRPRWAARRMSCYDPTKEKPPVRGDVGEAKGSQDVNVQRGQYNRSSSGCQLLC